jgi:hypothetical protein
MKEKSSNGLIKVFKIHSEKYESIRMKLFSFVFCVSFLFSSFITHKDGAKAENGRQTCTKIGKSSA